MGHGVKINKSDAATLTKDFREAASQGSISFDNGSGKTLLGQIYDHDVFDTILKQTDCTGIRIYYGLDSSQKFCLVLVGVNSDGDDISDGELFEYGGSCPPYCGESSPFNS